MVQCVRKRAASPDHRGWTTWTVGVWFVSFSGGDVSLSQIFYTCYSDDPLEPPDDEPRFCAAEHFPVAPAWPLPQRQTYYHST